jgi:hypothetical protein
VKLSEVLLSTTKPQTIILTKSQDGISETDDVLEIDEGPVDRKSPAPRSIYLPASVALIEPCLTVGKIKKIPLPLPPLAEQRRIVAKVDELMALCDRLEASLAAGDAARRRLLDAVLSAALEPATVGRVPQVRAAKPRQERLVLE